MGIGRIDNNRDGFQPTIKFYLQNKRAAELRGLCINIIKHVRSLITDEGLEQADKNIIKSQLEDLYEKLSELGISPKMSMNRPVNEYRNNPVTAAEYLAGQLICLRNIKIRSEAELEPIAREFSEGKVHSDEDYNRYVLENSTLPQAIKDFASVTSTLNFVEGLFNGDRE